MSRFRRFEIIEPTLSPSFFIKQTSIFTPKTLTLKPYFPQFEVEDEFNFIDFASPFDEIDTITDLIQIDRTPFYTSAKKVQVRNRLTSTESYLQSLCDRVSELELLVSAKNKSHKGDRKYTWTAEIESPEEEDGFDRKYKWTAEIKGGKKKAEKRYKWTAEIKGKGEKAPIVRKYTLEALSGDGGECTGSEKREKKEDIKKNQKKKSETGVGPTRVVEIEEPSDHGVIVLRQAFAKRTGKCKGKRKVLSPQDAAMMIQMSFRAHLIRRSQALRALRELAIAKTKLKEIRALFNNFSYRRRLTRDAEEHQRFTERIIVLLLTVDAIEGSDRTVRASKRSMVDELEAMLDVVDPQPASAGKSLSMRRRTFDMPDGLIQKELAEGVAHVVQMLDEEEE